MHLHWDKLRLTARSSSNWKRKAAMSLSFYIMQKTSPSSIPLLRKMISPTTRRLSTTWRISSCGCMRKMKPISNIGYSPSRPQLCWVHISCFLFFCFYLLGIKKISFSWRHGRPHNRGDRMLRIGRWVGVWIWRGWRIRVRPSLLPHPPGPSPSFSCSIFPLPLHPKSIHHKLSNALNTFSFIYRATESLSREVLSSAEQAVLVEVKKILHNEKESGAGGTVVDFTEVTFYTI